MLTGWVNEGLNKWINEAWYLYSVGGIFVESKGVGLCVWSPGNFIDAFSAVSERPILMLRWVVTAVLSWCHSGEHWLSIYPFVRIVDLSTFLPSWLSFQDLKFTSFCLNSPHPTSFVYVHMCVGAHACLCVYMCRPKVSLGCYSSSAIYLTFWYTCLLLAWASCIKLGYLASKLLGSTYVCLLSTGITNPGHYARLFYLGFGDQTQYQVLYQLHGLPTLPFLFSLPQGNLFKLWLIRYIPVDELKPHQTPAPEYLYCGRWTWKEERPSHKSYNEVKPKSRSATNLENVSKCYF